MTSFDRILVVLDPSLHPTPAVDRAIAVARAVGAKIWLGLFDAGTTVPWYATLGRASRSHIEALLRDDVNVRLEALREQVHASTGTDVEVIADHHRPDAGRIVSFAERHRVNLILKDADRDSALRRLVFVPLDWDLLRTSPVPLWLTGTPDAALPRSIAVAVDPAHAEHGAGPLNDTLLSAAKSLAATAQAPLRVFTCFAGLPFTPTLDPLGMGVGWTEADLSRRLKSEHQAAFDDLLEAHGIPPGQSLVLQGPPGDTLTSAIRQHATDLLVVGAIRRAGADRVLMGSTAEFLVSRAPCDILAIPGEAVVFPTERTLQHDVSVA